MELHIGRVVKPHGVRGEVVVEPTTDAPEERFAPGTRLESKRGPLTIAHARPHQGRLLVSFEEVPDRNAAEALRGTRFFAASREEDDGGFYDHELEGLEVVKDGERVGEVTAVNRNTRQALLVVGLEGGGEALVPFVEAIVPEVDLEAGRVVITPPDGLLEL